MENEHRQSEPKMENIPTINKTITPEQLEEKRKELYKKSISSNLLNLPIRFKDKTIELFEGKKEVVNLALSALNRKRGLYLFGKCGTGKTHLACGLLTHFFAKDIYVKQYKQGDGVVEFIHEPSPADFVFLLSSEFFLEIKQGFNEGVSESKILNKYTGRKLLVIDDIGADSVSDWSRQLFYVLIDRLYRNMDKVIITSNFDLEAISNGIDDRIASRIVEMCEIINLGSRDKRVNP